MNAKKQSKTKSLLKPTALTTLIAFVLVGCSGGSSEGDQVPTFTSPRSSSNLTDTTNTPIDTSNGDEDNSNDDTNDDQTAVADDLTNQELLDAFEAQLNSVKSEVKDNGDSLDTLKIGGLIGALALGAISITGDRINHKNDDKNRDEVLGKINERADTTDQGVEKYGKANALLNTAGLKVAAEGVAQGQKNGKGIATVDGNVAAARTDVATGFSSASEERAENQAEIVVGQRAAAKQAMESEEKAAARALASAETLQVVVQALEDQGKLSDIQTTALMNEISAHSAQGEAASAFEAMLPKIQAALDEYAEYALAQSNASVEGVQLDSNASAPTPAAIEESADTETAVFRNSGS